MTETKICNKKYDLEERTYHFARNVALYCKKLPKSSSGAVYTMQLIRASGSVGANYIEANEALSRKDFLMRIKICRKEAKESSYWLRLINDTNPAEFGSEGLLLEKEAGEFRKIFSAIISNAG